MRPLHSDPLDHPWCRPPTVVCLPDGAVHVWRAALDQDPDRLGKLQQTLSADEQARAQRFHFDRDRQHFSAGRGILRTILARYLAADPAQLEFAYGPHGKPSLAQNWAGGALRFNVSHSGGLALFAVARGREIGVDVEAIRPLPDLEQIAERFFSAHERIGLRAIPEDRRLAAFFTCWTRKEAYIKAKSTGLSLPLDRFDVSLEPNSVSALLEVLDDPHETARWQLREIPAAPGYVAAVAVEGAGWTQEYWQWSGTELERASQR